MTDMKEQMHAKLNALQEGLPPLQEQAKEAREALRVAKTNRTPEGLEALITAQQRSEAADDMLAQQQEDIRATQAEIARLEAAEQQAALDAEHARNVQAYQEALAKWEAAAQKFGKSLQEQLNNIAALEVEVSQAHLKMSDSQRIAGAEEVPALRFPLRELMGDHVQPGESGGWTLAAGVYRVSGKYRRPGMSYTLPRFHKGSSG